MNRLCLLVLASCLLSLPARADGIPIVGDAFQEKDEAQFFQFNSPTTSFSVSADNIEFGFPPTCSTTPCDLTVTIPTSSVPHPQSFTWIDGTTGQCGLGNPPTCTGFLTGELTFLNPGFTIALPLSTFFTLSGTIPFFGQLDGFLGDFPTANSQVFSVDLSGTANYLFRGHENSDGNAAIVTLTQFNFEGTATPVPEPSSLLLLGSGLMLFARWKRKRA